MANSDTIEQVKEDIQVHIPNMYKVLLHNDDKTTFDFVIEVLIGIYHRSLDDAIELTTHIHHNGQAIAGGPYTKEIAEEKVHETTGYARANGFPLTATLEEI